MGHFPAFKTRKAFRDQREPPSPLWKLLPREIAARPDFTIPRRSDPKLTGLTPWNRVQNYGKMFRIIISCGRYLIEFIQPWLVPPPRSFKRWTEASSIVQIHANLSQNSTKSVMNEGAYLGGCTYLESCSCSRLFQALGYLTRSS